MEVRVEVRVVDVRVVDVRVVDVRVVDVRVDVPHFEKTKELRGSRRCISEP